MLKLENVNKNFKDVLIAKDLNLDFENYTYGLLGRNGSGKTTLLRCITKIEKLSGGKISYIDKNGKAVKNYLSEIGYLPQSFDIFNTLTCFEALQFFANLKEYNATNEELDELLKSVNLTEKRDVLIKNLSGGMKRRLGIAQSLIGSPDVLLLDEPTSGLDPEERINFKNVIRQVKKDRCIVLSTHIITDIDSLCDKILVLHGGKITQFDSCKELADIAEGKVFAVVDSSRVDAEYFSMGTVDIDGRQYEKIITKTDVDGIKLQPTLEDGYICLLENLS